MEATDAAAAFAALSVETRLALLRLLMAAGPTGLPAGDLAASLALPPSTTSFHLAALERAGLTHATRQGRQIIHAPRIAGIRQLLAFLTETCCGGQPDLCGDLARLLPPEPAPAVAPAFTVLFLCRHNAARSIMAEAILKRLGGPRFQVFSAGSEPASEASPEVLARLRALGHDTAGLRSKSWHDFTGPGAPRMDFVITLCDPPDGPACPEFGDRCVTGAWPLPDPARFSGSRLERDALLNELYAGLERRLRAFIALPFATLDRAALQQRLDALGSYPRPSRQMEPA